MVVHTFKIAMQVNAQMVMWCEDCGLTYVQGNSQAGKPVWQEMAFEDENGNPTRPHMRCDEASQQTGSSFAEAMTGALKDAFASMSGGGAPSFEIRPMTPQEQEELSKQAEESDH